MFASQLATKHATFFFSFNTELFYVQYVSKVFGLAGVELATQLCETNSFIVQSTSKRDFFISTYFFHSLFESVAVLIYF